MDHVKLLLTVMNITLGTWVISFLLHRRNRNPRQKGLVALALHTLCYNLLLWGAVLDKYLRLNLRGFRRIGDHLLYRRAMDLIFILLVGGMTLAVLKIRREFIHTKGPPRRSPLAVGMVLLWAATLTAGLLFHRTVEGPLPVLLEATGDLFAAVEAVLLVLILRQGLTEVPRDRVKTAFATLYLSRYLGIVILLLIPASGRFFPSMGLLFLFNLIPFLWMRLVVDKALLPTAVEGADLKRLTAGRGISPRETEVIKLLLLGKSNREIEELLFISPHTVKNHIYNIYKKMGIKSRYELMSLLSSPP